MARRIKKLLVANRSEIACRIIRACRELGISTVAVYSTVDNNALSVKMADEAVCIGQAEPSDSYLNMDKIIKAALDNNCDAIHPGYGFLAEKAEFNKKVRESGLIFVGPEPDSMQLLGSKVKSRELMINSGVPVIPGMQSSSDKIDEFVKIAEEIGYPVLIKASDGGGGKGMRIVRKEEDLEGALSASIRESENAFGSSSVYLEKYIESPRHIEIQIAVDNYGNAVHLFERECSIQRRHQKIIEESPSVALSDNLRQTMGDTAIRAVKAANYTNIGTVEFLLDKNNNFYFLEVNTRIQVEHPVTEMVTGVDLVKLQIKLAEGGRMPFTQKELSQNGHSIECRIYAEDAENHFLPSSGKILLHNEPKGPWIRYDSGIDSDSEVTVYYDPILAKLIVWGRDREEARVRMINALRENVILGVNTSHYYLEQILNHISFINGETYTDFIDKADLSSKDDEMKIIAALIAGEISSIHSVRLDAGPSNQIPSPWISVGKWEIGKGSNYEL